MRTAVAGALLFSFAALASPNLDKARALVAELKYAEAAKALAAAETAAGNTRRDLIDLYELEGIVFGTLNRPEPARAAFAKLLTLDPEHKLTGKLTPRVTTPFYEAKGKSQELGAIELKHGAAVANEKVEGLGFTLKDPLGLAKKLVVHVSEDGKPWRDVSQPAGPQVMVRVSGRQIYWYAALLGDHDAELFSAFTAGGPGLERVPEARPVIEPKPELEPKEAPPEVTAPVEMVRRPRLRGIGHAFVVLSLIASTISFAFVVSYITSVNRWNNAERLPGGVVNITRVEAYDLDARVGAGGKAMEIMLPITAVLIAGGIGMYTWGWHNAVEVPK